MHFLVGRSNFDNFFQPKKAVRPQRKSWLEEGDCICVNEIFFSWPFISALSALFSSPFFLSFFLSCFEALFVCVWAQNLPILMVYLRAPDHDVASLCQWRSSERTYCSAQNITHFCAHIDPAFGSDRNEWIHAFRTLQEPVNRFRVCEGKRSFRRSRKAGKKKRSRSGPTDQEMLPAKDERISLKNLTKPDYSMSAKSFFRDRQTDGRSCTSEDSTIVDAVLTPLHFSPVLSHSATSCETTRARNALQRATLSRPEVPRGILRHLHVIWHASTRLSWSWSSLSCPTRTERLKRCALRQLEDLPVACLSKKKKGNENVPTLWAVLERHDDLQLAKTKTNKTFQPAKSDQIFV